MPGSIDSTMENRIAAVATDHYRAYTPCPFTRAERDTVTILFGGLHWRIERILQAVLESSGYRARILPRSEEHTSELQSLRHLVCRLLLEKKKINMKPKQKKRSAQNPRLRHLHSRTTKQRERSD